MSLFGRRAPYNNRAWLGLLIKCIIVFVVVVSISYPFRPGNRSPLDNELTTMPNGFLTITDI